MNAFKAIDRLDSKSDIARCRAETARENGDRDPMLKMDAKADAYAEAAQVIREVDG